MTIKAMIAWSVPRGTRFFLRLPALVAAAIVGSLLAASPALAIPALQLYVEGATYNRTTESWEISGFSDGTPFRLWAIGNVGVDKKGNIIPIQDVRLSIAYSAAAESEIPLQFSIEGSSTNGYGGFADPSLAADPYLIQRSTNGSTPILGDGKPLPAHGIYGQGTYWQEFMLGDFILRDSHLADFIGDFPSPSEMFPNAGQISVYEITLTGGPSAHPVDLHFDLYDHIEAGNHVKARFAPFSHDGDADVHVTPEPSTFVIWGLMATLGAVFYRRNAKRRATSCSPCCTK